MTINVNRWKLSDFRSKGQTMTGKIKFSSNSGDYRRLCCVNIEKRKKQSVNWNEICWEFYSIIFCGGCIFIFSYKHSWHQQSMNRVSPASTLFTNYWFYGAFSHILSDNELNGDGQAQTTLSNWDTKPVITMILETEIDISFFGRKMTRLTLSKQWVYTKGRWYVKNNLVCLASLISMWTYLPPFLTIKSFTLICIGE